MGEATKSSYFNRCTPLLERKRVPCEIITLAFQSKNNSCSASNDNATVQSKRRETFTLRVLEGYRTNNHEVAGGGTERAIRLELSTEFRNQSMKVNTNQCTPQRESIRRIQTHNNSSMPSMIHNLSSPLLSNTRHSFSCSSSDEATQQHDSNISVPIHLYELEVGESDFAALQQDQALLVDFSNFSKSFIDLLRLCDLGSQDNDDGEEKSSREESFEEQKCDDIKANQNFINPLLGCQLSASGGTIMQGSVTASRRSTSRSISNLCDARSTYSCRVEEFSNASQTNNRSWNQNQKENIVRFNIVESNQFRELTHISLNMLSATDSSVKSYLSVRLSETLGSMSMLKYQLKKMEDCATSSENTCNEIKRQFNEFVSSTQHEKNALVQEVEETIQKQIAAKDEQYKELKAKCGLDFEALKKSSSNIHQSLQTEIDRLGSVNKKLNDEIFTAMEDNRCLTKTKSEKEDKLIFQSGELKHLHECLEDEKGKIVQIESQFQETQKLLATVKKEADEKGAKLLKVENKMKVINEKVNESNGEAETCAVRLHAREQEFNTLREEFNKAKDLISRYQSDRQEMKRRMKNKVDMIQKQEEILASKDFNSTETQQLLRQIQNDLDNARKEIEVQKQEIDSKNKIIDDNSKTLENNQKVRH